MNSYLENAPVKPRAFNANASVFMPQISMEQKDHKHQYLDPGTKLKEKNASALMNSDPTTSQGNSGKQQPIHYMAQGALKVNAATMDEGQIGIIDTMRKQNEIATRLLQQQSLHL